VYTIRVWAVNEAGSGPAAEVMGQTGAVAPSVCGAPRATSDNADEGALNIEWDPPLDPGGADVVAYRIWLRPVFQDGLGNFFPADNFLDLGLFEHRGGFTALQAAPVKLSQLPSCSGCLCSVAAINAAGLTGPSTKEAPVVWASNIDREKEIFELGASTPVPTDKGAAPAAPPAGHPEARERPISSGYRAGPASAPAEHFSEPVPHPAGLSGHAPPVERRFPAPREERHKDPVPRAPADPPSMGWWAEAATPARAGASSSGRNDAATVFERLPMRSAPSWDVSGRGSLVASAGPPLRRR